VLGFAEWHHAGAWGSSHRGGGRGKEVSDAPAKRHEFSTTCLATDLRVHYAEQGNPTGDAIIFHHAYVDSWFSYSRVLSLLSAEYHAFAFDQRGHGNSDKPECCYTGDAYADDVEAFMDAVGIEKATLVGDSSGGMIAQRVALDYPHRVSGLVLIGSPTTLVNNETVIELGKEMLALRSHLTRVRQGVGGGHDPTPAP
jgi:non-heme chloroperoxidase